MCDLARLLPTLDVWGDERDKDDISLCGAKEREGISKWMLENICILKIFPLVMLHEIAYMLRTHFIISLTRLMFNEALKRTVYEMQMITHHCMTLTVMRRSCRWHWTGTHAYIVARILERLDGIVLLRWIDLNFLWWSMQVLRVGGRGWREFWVRRNNTTRRFEYWHSDTDTRFSWFKGEGGMFWNFFSCNFSLTCIGMWTCLGNFRGSSHCVVFSLRLM